MLVVWRYGSLPERLPKKLLGGVRDGRTPPFLLHPSLINIAVTINGVRVTALLDTGATTSLISSSILKNIRHSRVHLAETSAILGDGNTTIRVVGTVALCITVNNITTILNTLIVETLGAPLILGMDWCKENKVTVNMEQRQVNMEHPVFGSAVAAFVEGDAVETRLAKNVELLPFHEHIVKMIVPFSSAEVAAFSPDTNRMSCLRIQSPDSIVRIKDFSFYMCLYNPTKYRHKLAANTRLGYVYYQQPCNMNYELNTIVPEHLIDINVVAEINEVVENHVAHIENENTREEFLAILQRYSKIFDTSRMSRADTIIHHTINTGDHVPTNVRPYYKTIEQRKELQLEVQKLLEQGILRPSHSPWSSPVLLKRKPDGTYRFLVDFRRLNAITQKDSYPQPSAEELLHRLAGARFFTKLDLKSGYFQIPIQESDIPKTAIITQDGLYEFTVLAQGLMNSPATFQRVMNDLLANGRWDYVVVYLDDIVVFSKTMEEHKRHVEEVLRTLWKARFQVSPAKCAIAMERIEFLSHIVTFDRVEPSPDKIQAIIDIAPPTSLSQANRFIGKVGYYRKFIKDFANIAAPIHKVTNKTRTKRHEFRWGEEQQMAFDKFKSILTSAPLFLDFPDRSVPFVLSTDASEVRIAGILKQFTNDGMKICYYKSRLLTDIERRYSTTEREALAVYWCIMELRNYIADTPITVETDHEPLVNMHRKNNFRNRRIDNWLIHLQDMIPQILEIRYKRGKDNTGPDYLTRCNFRESKREDVVLHAITRSAAKKQNPTLQNNIHNESSPSGSTITSTTLVDLTLEKIKLEQDTDANVQHILENISKDQTNQTFVMANGILFRLITKRNSRIKSKVPYLPTSMISDVLKAFHDHPISGHFGIKRTFYKLRNRFWWPKIRKDIEDYIGSCLQCATHNIVRKKMPGHLTSFEPPADVFQMLHMDFWGPVRCSKEGNRYVLVLTDNLSKYVIAKAMPTNTARAVAQFLIKDFIMIHGVPGQIITDNGVHFSNRLIEELTKSMNIKHGFSVSYHPETNGQVERFNATFCTQLAKYYDEGEDDWDEYLSSILYAYNTGIHSTTGFAPYELAFGRKNRTPFDIGWETRSLPSHGEFYHELQRLRKVMIKQSRRNIRHHQTLSQNRYNKDRQDMQYSIGDLVYLKVCNGRSKMDKRWVGPYTVIRKTGRQHYVLQNESTHVTDRAHVSQLQPATQRKSFNTN